MELMFWILLGITSGWMSSIILGTRKTQGLLTDIVLGATGAIVGGLVLSIMGSIPVASFSLYSIALAILSSVVLIWIGRLVTRKEANQ